MNPILAYFEKLPAKILGEAAAEAGKTLFTLPERVLATLAVWQNRAEERARLREMEGHILKDIGITREQARKEARKPFWRA